MYLLRNKTVLKFVNRLIGTRKIIIMSTALNKLWLFLELYWITCGPPLWSSGQSSWLHNGDVLFPVRYELNLYMLCRRK
jgi:hypothetical protein